MICEFQRVGTLDCSRFSSDGISVAKQDLCTYDIIVDTFEISFVNISEFQDHLSQQVVVCLRNKNRELVEVEQAQRVQSQNLAQ